MVKGEERTFWDNVGQLTIFIKDDGSENGKLELYSFASKTTVLNVFEFRKREETNQPVINPVEKPVATSAPEEEIKVENIPF